MRYIRPIFAAGIVAIVAVAMIVPSIAYAGPDSLVSTFQSSGVTVLPVFAGYGERGDWHDGPYGYFGGFKVLCGSEGARLFHHCT